MYRRLGIGFKLVTKLESWFRDNGAEYAYMATDKDNDASINLFTHRCGYSKFRTPSILVQPVFVHRLSVSRHVSIINVSPSEAETLYRQKYSATEFFPRDIDSILKNKLSLGSFIAVRSDYRWSGVEEFLTNPPESWAVMSLWDSKAVFRLEVRGAGKIRKGFAWTTRLMDRVLPCFRIPSVPNLFKPFGLYVMYGLFGSGPDAGELVKSLCKHAHNLARVGGCGVVATELAGCDPLREAVPHWRRLSCAEDLWCIKRIADDYSDGEVGDWTKSTSESTIFVDPREF